MSHIFRFEDFVKLGLGEQVFFEYELARRQPRRLADRTAPQDRGLCARAPRRKHLDRDPGRVGGIELLPFFSGRWAWLPRSSAASFTVEAAALFQQEHDKSRTIPRAATAEAE
jgi:hypothetical protein